MFDYVLYIAVTILAMIVSSAVTALHVCNNCPESSAPDADDSAHDDAHDDAPIVIEQTKPDHLEWPFIGNNRFAGKNVAFIGDLGMSLHDAMQHVEANGGKAYTALCDDVNLLVVGDNPNVNVIRSAMDRNV